MSSNPKAQFGAVPRFQAGDWVRRRDPRLSTTMRVVSLALDHDLVTLELADGFQTVLRTEELVAWELPGVKMPT